MKKKELEHWYWVDSLLDPTLSATDNDIAEMNESLCINSDMLIITSLTVNSFIGFILCTIFNIGAWYILPIGILLTYILIQIAGNIEHSRVFERSQLLGEYKKLKKLCNNATNFEITISLKTDDHNNLITLEKGDGGWIFSGRKPLNIQTDLFKDSKFIWVNVKNEFIKNGISQKIVFFCKKTKKTKNTYTNLKLDTGDNFVHLYGSPEQENGNYAFEEIYIHLNDIRRMIFERIIKSLQPYNDDIISANSYWSKKYLFKSDKYRQEKLHEYYNIRFAYEDSKEFAKVKCAPLGKKTTAKDGIYGVYVYDSNVKYTHEYIAKGTSAFHIFETEHFIITIRQYIK